MLQPLFIIAVVPCMNGNDTVSFKSHNFIHSPIKKIPVMRNNEHRSRKFIQI
ncbi:hypothetical protein D3C77_709050 [compost metagenome]